MYISIASRLCMQCAFRTFIYIYIYKYNTFYKARKNGRHMCTSFDKSSQYFGRYGTHISDILNM